MSVFIKGIAIGGFRGIGAEQKIGPFDRFNFFAGPNNSGKSTVLDFIQYQFGRSVSDRRFSTRYEGTKVHTGSNDTDRVFGLLETKRVFFDKIVELSAGRAWPNDWSPSELVKAILTEVDGLWFKLRDGTHDQFSLFADVDHDAVAKIADQRHWQLVWQTLYSGRGGGSLLGHWVPETLKFLDNLFELSFPQSHLIPAIRQVGKAGFDFEGYSGQGIIDYLQALQNPPPEREIDRERFSAINRLVQTVLGKPEARIEIPHTKESIVVHMDNKSLALEDLGTGIQEVILIGAYCTIYDGSIMCLEEPEIHLHPILQRQLLEYLRDETTSQYFIATHSAAFLDMPNGRIFAVANDGKATTVTPLRSRNARSLLTNELGYRASDIIQANAVIWVEGASDRLYLLNWIKQLKPNFIEGIQFSIMFYGGRLLNHLSGESEIDEDFINLRALNQASAMIIDSDKAKPRQQLNPTKKRIVAEFSNSLGFAWVTKGREIENYLNPDDLIDAMKAVHPQKFGTALGKGEYDNRLVFKHAKTGASVTADKVDVAKQMVKGELSLDYLDLKPKLNGLVEFIQKANGMQPS